MRIDEFDLFTFSYFCIPFEQIAAFLQQQWGNNEKYRLKQTPFKFDLFDKSHKRAAPISRKPTSSFLSVIVTSA